MKYPQKSFTYEGKKYKAKNHTKRFAYCAGCAFDNGKVACTTIEKTKACAPAARDDNNYIIWVEVNKRS